MKSIKEKQLLVKWSKAMNEPIDPALVEEVERFEKIQKEIVESVRVNTLKDLHQASVFTEVVEVEKETIDYPKPPTLEEVLSVLKEEENELVQTQAIEESPKTEEAKSLAERAAEHITKEVKLEEKSDSYQQPDAELPGRTINDLRKKIKYIEDWVAKISLTGPGGGAGDVINLDYPVKVVDSDYTLTRKDYYVGVNANTAVYITIPDTIAFPGRRIIIKDESGRCSKFPIIVSGNVDNDPGGFILRINNGAIQMIYREGWRIV